MDSKSGTSAKRSVLLNSSQEISHGFFSRVGGVSEGIYASLNCGFGSDDNPEQVAQNRSVVAQVLGVAPANLLTVYQIHSSDVIVVTEPWERNEAPKADAMVTQKSGIALGILAADCGPVLLADPEAHVIGAAHAGWKGAIGGVLDQTLSKMELLGADRMRIRAAVGPCISQSSYEVGPEFKERFVKQDPQAARFFVDSSQPESSDRSYFDLPKFIAARLASLGVDQVDVMGACTYADELYFSYRRTTHQGESDYGRNISAIALNA